jgi:fructoselysine-6-P-deglycase FrlB-like protein
MLVLANHDETLDGTIALVKTALSRGAQVSVLGTDDAVQQMDDLLGASAGTRLLYAAVTAQAITAPIIMIAAGQCFALELALARNHDPDLSRGVSKVTITR